MKVLEYIILDEVIRTALGIYNRRHISHHYAIGVQQKIGDLGKGMVHLPLRQIFTIHTYPLQTHTYSTERASPPLPPNTLHEPPL